MYELFESNERDESLYLLEEDISSLNEAIRSLKDCPYDHCQIEKFGIPDSLTDRAKMLKKRDPRGYERFLSLYSRYTLIATKHNGKITKFY